MSLLTTYTDANKVEHTALVIRIQCTGLVAEVGTKRLYEWHRYTTKDYSYVGMTKAAAKTCAEAKATSLTRNFNVYTVNTETATATVEVRTDLQCDIQPVHDEGGMWHTDIHVNEDDVAYSSSAAIQPAWPATGDYDE